MFPPQFQKMLKGALEHHAAGSSLTEVLTNVCEGTPELRKVLFLPSGEVSPFIAFSVLGSDSIYTATSSSVPLKPGDTVEVILAMAGG
ncbi:MAG TPA: MoaD/ThiS family protein [Kofleriaceae bacterium]